LVQIEVWQEFAKNAKLANASGNQVIVLATVIDDDDFGLGHKTSGIKKRAKPETVFARNKPQEKGEMFVS
jgi:hypothetical protein